MKNAKNNIPANNFAEALKIVRNAKSLSQEDFGVVSSRTYVSSLERGLKSPTLKKIEALAGVLGVHPLTVLTMAYLENPKVESPKDLLTLVENEVTSLRKA